MTKLQGRELYESIGSPKRIVAPMVDQSELAWRILSRRYGATLCYTPMFHARLFATSEKYRQDMWGEWDGDAGKDRPLVVQFCANDPEYLLQAAKHVVGKCDAVDLNLGCPQGIARKGNYGSFLMENWDLIYKLINKLHTELDVPVTAKIRVFEDREKTLEYAKMVLSAGAQFLTVHGRTREMKGQKTGLADWSIIKYLRDNLPQDTVFFANGNILYPDDISRCLTEIGCDAVMSAEGNLYNPGVFVDAEEDLKRQFPRVDHILREYYEIVKDCPGNASKIAMKSHIFKVLRPFLEVHTDIRQEVAKMNTKYRFDDVERVVKLVEATVEEIFAKPDIEQLDVITAGDKQLWGGSYKKVPYWRCQPYFRPVNGVSGDKRVTEALKSQNEPLKSQNEPLKSQNEPLTSQNEPQLSNHLPHNKRPLQPDNEQQTKRPKQSI
ncbi:tRNA-dihydrouridine synthase family protein [Cyberlindnera jadinii NRRL Y-1542]|uniref:tRNA-dihydrouridine(16/17) synthase [NAD(P)(+)] n=1 Tax=Cyberlindnera jadinii (strain ATCC 18201 / CBS 1600 / BCRC 20928 / JCM 3617 / NBRC 0987 / NRRL Y-1542) TaxID=983966 RepID=A0A1E4RV99_CYBJN|nr:Dus-domain-containing protein [Cyberlindnera jadinii NRRL Y-1542]ODV71209.1 Dus-domain-containing protein [Cyberlindnera jadinii NRRL Y-1542]